MACMRVGLLGQDLVDAPDLRMIAEKAGHRHSFHELRHAFATIADSGDKHGVSVEGAGPPQTLPPPATCAPLTRGRRQRAVCAPWARRRVVEDP